MDSPPAYMSTIAHLHQFAQRHPQVAIVPSHCARSLAPWVEPEVQPEPQPSLESAPPS